MIQPRASQKKRAAEIIETVLAILADGQSVDVNDIADALGTNSKNMARNFDMINHWLIMARDKRRIVRRRVGRAAFWSVVEK
jgi:hypothetical protein